MRGIIVTGVAEREGNEFVSLCPELGVASCGDTAEEALDMLDDALQVYIEDVLDIGNLDKVLLEKGVNIRADIPGKDEKVLVSALPGQILRIYVLKIPVLATG